MFCQSANDSDEKRPNVNICPICLGHPGTLPVINKAAVRSVLLVGHALGGRLADFTEFDRKNYFYPDIPKGYQISQYKYPLVAGGELAGVQITRIHLEEDTARSQHDPKTGESLVDFNRAGVPLMELVTEPVIKNAKQAGDFARELKLLLGPEYLNVSAANLEKGEMRVEANISVSTNDYLGTKVEVKNLNSFRAVEKAIDYEFARQRDLLASGGTVVQETRGWDENNQQTFSQRQKEMSHDYRYFPDPDLPKLKLSAVPELTALADSLPELPAEKSRRFHADYGLKAEDIKVIIASAKLSAWFEEVVGQMPVRPGHPGGPADAEKNRLAQTAANYIVSDLTGLLAGDFSRLPSPANLAELMLMIKDGQVSSRGAKDILSLMIADNRSPQAIAEAENLFQKSDQTELTVIIEKVIADQPAVVADFRGGNDKVLQFLIGQGMKESKGTANPAVLAKMFIESIKKSTDK